MNMTEFNNIQDPVVRAEAMRAQAMAQMLIDAVEGLRGLFKGAAVKLAAYLQYRRTYSALSDMTDRELDDIGISRTDIPAVARGIDPRVRMEVPADALAQRQVLSAAFDRETEVAAPANQDHERPAVAA